MMSLLAWGDARPHDVQMTLDQLRVFVAVAERQHVTRAAEALNLGQSAVSAAIAALEFRHDAKLFHRVGRGIALTETGTLFLDAAIAILAQADAAELLLHELSGGARGTLTLQASQTIASYWLPRHLVAFHRQHGGITINMSVGNTAQVAQAVHRGDAELGFVEGSVDNELLRSQVVARDKMVVVVGPTHKWAGASPAPGDLAQSEWVLREPGSGTRSEFEQAVAGFGVKMSDLTVALELPSNESVRAAVEAGLGATALSSSVAAPSLEAGFLRQVGITLPDRNFTVLWHAERYQSHAAQKFLDVIRAA
jgi:DNA-binding transcriptional LysR family regulator